MDPLTAGDGVGTAGTNTSTFLLARISTMKAANPTTNNTLHTTIPQILRLRIGPLLGGRYSGSSICDGGGTVDAPCVVVSSVLSHNIPVTT